MKYLLYGIVILLGLTVLTSLYSSVTTVITAPARVLGKTLETNNIIQSYEWFYDVHASYLARHNQVLQYKEFLTSETDLTETRTLRMETAAMQQSCRTLVTKYNANSEKMNKKVFKGWALPAALNINSCE